MDFSDVFQFFTALETLTPAQRRAELFCVVLLALLLAAAVAFLLCRAVRKSRKEGACGSSPKEPDADAEN